MINGNSSIYDPYWVVAPPFLAIAIKAAGGSGSLDSWNLRQVCILMVLFVWSSRYHIFYKWSGWRTGLVHEDWRYEQMRRFPLPYWLNSLLGMHLFPTFLVYFAFVPAALVLEKNPSLQASFSILDFLGFIGGLTAVGIQFAADEQLRKYRLTSEYQAGGTFRGGFWNYSRHPNYFGEVLFWVSMIPFAISAGLFVDNPVLILVGPILMAAFFRMSAWLMDSRSLQRRPDYRQVMDHVHPLIPWFPKK
jgi:steroid 5-alpha reductase family enzyme